LARLRIVREYEALAEGANVHPGVIVSFLARGHFLLEDKKANFAGRLSGVALTTVIVRGGVLCGYRLRSFTHSGDITPQMLLEEIIRWLRIIKETWGRRHRFGACCRSGCGLRILCPRWRPKFHCIGQFCSCTGRSPMADCRHDARPLADREADGLVGWMMHQN